MHFILRSSKDLLVTEGYPLAMPAGTAAVLWLGALAPWPYGYYTFLRWVVCMAAWIAAFRAHDSERFGTAWTFGLVTLLCNPLIPIHLTRVRIELLGRDPKMGAAIPLPAVLVRLRTLWSVFPVADRAESVGRHAK